MLVRVARSRCRVEKTFQPEKGPAGLDEHQVRRFASWTRWVTLAMLAHAFLAVVRADEHARAPSPANLIPLSCNEIQRLFMTLVVQPIHDAAHRLWLVRLATPPPGLSANRSLPTKSRSSDMKITIYSWSTIRRPKWAPAYASASDEWLLQPESYLLGCYSFTRLARRKYLSQPRRQGHESVFPSSGETPSPLRRHQPNPRTHRAH